MRLVVGVTGASGMVYASRLLEWLDGPGRERGVSTDLVLSRTAATCWRLEVGRDPQALYDIPLHGPADFTAAFASGSARYDAMAVVPCSSGHLGRIALGLGDDLVCRAAEVALKERRRLVLLLRESPYSLALARNIARAIEAGAVVMPASPAFYTGPRTVAELVDGVVSRLLDQLGIDNRLAPRWEGPR